MRRPRAAKIGGSMAGQHVHSGPIAGHVREKRRFLPPLAATGRLVIGDWVRDDLPDLIWPALVFRVLGTSGAGNFTRWQQAVLRDLDGDAAPLVLADGLDGRLTSLDRLVEAIPGTQETIRQRAIECGLLPGDIVDALLSYPNHPAPWIIASTSIHPMDEDSWSLTAAAVLDVLRDGHREALIKCLPIWSAVLAGTFRADDELIDLLRDYPTNSSRRSTADTNVRAAWGARKMSQLQQDPDRYSTALKWARDFWTFNSMTSRCIREENQDDQEGQGGGSEPAPLKATDGAHLRSLTLDLLSSYVEALDKSPKDLHRPARYEVHAGLVMRVGTEVVTALGHPDMWCLEHSAHIVRALTETRIVLHWMATQDLEIYEQFQAYGQGKAKLLGKIAEEIPQPHQAALVDEAISEFERLSRNDGPIDFRIVDTRDSFAEGRSLRVMAEECGLLDLYRHTYGVASGVAHGEWWSLETHRMVRCRNVLHGGHLIASLSLSAGGNLDLAQSWVDFLYAIMRTSLDVLMVPEETVTEAYRWLGEEP